MGSVFVKGESAVKQLRLLILLTVQNATLVVSCNTRIYRAFAAKSRSIDRGHILIKTVSASEGLSVCMSAVFCLLYCLCIPSWQLSRQVYSCLYYPSNWLVSAELHIHV